MQQFLFKVKKFRFQSFSFHFHGIIFWVDDKASNFFSSSRFCDSLVVVVGVLGIHHFDATNFSARKKNFFQRENKVQFERRFSDFIVLRFFERRKNAFKVSTVCCVRAFVVGFCLLHKAFNSKMKPVERKVRKKKKWTNNFRSTFMNFGFFLSIKLLLLLRKRGKKRQPVKSAGMWAMCRHFNRPFLIEKIQIEMKRNETYTETATTTKAKQTHILVSLARYIRKTHKLRENDDDEDEEEEKSVCVCVFVLVCVHLWAILKVKMKFIIFFLVAKARNGTISIQNSHRKSATMVTTMARHETNVWPRRKKTHENSTSAQKTPFNGAEY